MKKGSYWAFILGFSGPFLVTTGALFFATGQFSMLDSNTILQCLLIIGSVSLLIALFTLFSSLMQDHSPEQADFRLEISQEAGIFFRSLFLLKKPAFFPLWLSLGTLLFGYSLIKQGYPIPGALTLLVGQAFWFLTRGQIRRFIDSHPMDNHLYPYLVWTLRAIDAICLLSAAGVIGSLGEYGEIVDNLHLMGAALLISVAYVGIQAARNQEAIDMDHVLKTTAGFLWVAMAIAAINFGFDFRAPISTKQLTYSECMDYRELVLSGKSLPVEEKLDCHYFSRMNRPQSDSTIEFILHRGALGVNWKKGRLIQ